MKVLFMGTPDFAVPCLKSLIKEGHDICGVFTQPDKPKGRGYVLTPPPVKEEALKHDIPVFQPLKMKDGEAFSIINELNPEIIVVVAYGKILPKEIIDFPKYGCINVHGSLLPKYRGAAPIQWAVLNGEKVTGITTMYMDVGLDTGDMLLKAETNIGESETSGELYERLSIIGADLIVDTLKEIVSGDIQRIKQNDDEATHSPMLSKSLSTIDWNKTSNIVHNQVRGLNPWPTASTLLNGKTLKIHKTKICDKVGGYPGEVLSINPFIVSCGNNTAIEILELQYQGKKRMNSSDFLRGHKLEVKTRLGE